MTTPVAKNESSGRFLTKLTVSHRDPGRSAVRFSRTGSRPRASSARRHTPDDPMTRRRGGVTTMSPGK